MDRATRMSQAVRIDPKTGRKLFATRAAKATDKIAGKGYSTVDDEALKTLPPPPPGAVFNAEEQAKYRAFKEARARRRRLHGAWKATSPRISTMSIPQPPVPRDAADRRMRDPGDRRRLRRHCCSGTS